MPVVINENKQLGLKVVNGAGFIGKGIIHSLRLKEVIVGEKLSSFIAPPPSVSSSSSTRPLDRYIPTYLPVM